VFYLAALSAIKRPDGPSRLFYLRERGEGKAPYTGLDCPGTSAGRCHLGADL
jgi:hypothetical protein